MKLVVLVANQELVQVNRQHQVKEGRLLIDNSNINQQSQQLIQWV